MMCTELPRVRVRRSLVEGVVKRVFPWVKALAEAAPLDETLKELRRGGLGDG
ncbi:hypothetical protein [Pyrobaculum sp.]|uniref:hypothetical protein n=1 Tax=Pyrobaculum sp. TaxID=2004705 RepID=UPI00315E37D9